MCIWNPVGPGFISGREDGAAVQFLMNYWVKTKKNLPPLRVDGSIGTKTLNLVGAFLAEKCPGEKAITRGGKALRVLQDYLPDTTSPDEISLEVLSFIYVNQKSRNQDRLLPFVKRAMTKYQISTPRRMAHFLAQVGHESAGFRYMQELASGEKYEGRVKNLGNTEKGDGKRFKGRGLIQLTGRSNYEDYGNDKGIDLTSPEADPSMIEKSPELCVDVAGWYWKKKDLNVLADLNDVSQITKKINGGYNGFDDRWRIFDRAEFLMMKKAWPSAAACSA